MLEVNKMSRVKALFKKIPKLHILLFVKGFELKAKKIGFMDHYWVLPPIQTSGGSRTLVNPMVTMRYIGKLSTKPKSAKKIWVDLVLPLQGTNLED